MYTSNLLTNRTKQLIEEIEQWLVGKNFPTNVIRIDSGAVVVDLKIFFESHLKVARAQLGRTAVIPYVLRMLKVRDLIIEYENNNIT